MSTNLQEIVKNFGAQYIMQVFTHVIAQDDFFCNCKQCDLS